MNLQLGYTQWIMDMCRKYGMTLEQTAYILATAYHETAHTMEPVKEGFYLGEERAERHRRKLDYYPYYGRGFVQLTHRYNYQRATDVFGVDLVSDPDLALDPILAAEIIVRGMLEGWFGRPLTQYVGEGKRDYYNARRSVNALDRARHIMSLAVEYEKILKSEGDIPYQEPPKKQGRKMKLAIVVGHNEVSQGATRNDTGVTEYVYNSELASMMKIIADRQYRNMEVKVFHRQSGGGYSSEINRVYADVDMWGADASIELHFNSFGDSSVSGTETLSSGSRGSLILAEEVQMEMVETLGLKDRGIKIRNRRTKGRGYLSLISGSAPAILVEPFFGTSERGLSATDDHAEKQALAEAILEGARSALMKITR